jgi:hypothetical protein
MAIGKLRRVTLRTNPQMFDRVIQDLQQGLANELPWLDHCFGRCERLVKIVDGRRYYTPNLYIGGGEYIPVSPDKMLGNYSFVMIDEPEQVISPNKQAMEMRAPFSLIVWIDLRTTDPRDERNMEEIKAEVLRAINFSSWIRSGHVHCDRVYTRAESIFDGFSLDEVDNQFLMAPYCGFRFTGEMMIMDVCRESVVNYLYVKPEDVQWIDENIDYDIFSNTFWKIV